MCGHPGLLLCERSDSKPADGCQRSLFILPGRRKDFSIPKVICFPTRSDPRNPLGGKALDQLFRGMWVILTLLALVLLLHRRLNESFHFEMMILALPTAY